MKQHINTKAMLTTTTTAIRRPYIRHATIKSNSLTHVNSQQIVACGESIGTTTISLQESRPASSSHPDLEMLISRNVGRGIGVRVLPVRVTRAPIGWRENLADIRVSVLCILSFVCWRGDSVGLEDVVDSWWSGGRCSQSRNGI